MKLTAANTAIVLDSTADFPEASDRFPNWRVVPLYVNFGDRQLQGRRRADGRTSSTSGCARRPELPTTSQPTPGDFLAAYEELGAVRAHPLAPHRVESLGDIPERRHGGAAARRRHACARSTRETASAAIAMLGARHPAPARARHDRRGDRRARRALSRRARPALHRRHARVPRARRPHRQGEGVRGPAAEREADPLDPRRRGAPGEARARQPQGVSGVRRRARDEHGRRARRSGSASRTPTRRSGWRSSRRWCATSGRRRRSRWRRRSAR